MKAIVQEKYGPAVDVLEVQDVEKPAVGEHDVLVRVRAAGVHRGTWHLVAGEPYLVRLGFGLRGPKTRVPGTDLAGVVEAVGSGVTQFKAGDEVFGIGEQSYAEYAAVPESQLVTKPPNLTFEQAAAVPESACTALRAVRDAGGVKGGEQVLVIGASGGVGSYAVQIAKALGATVTGVSSAAKAELVSSIGADDVIDYTREDINARGVKYDVVLDIGGRRSLSKLRSVLTPVGTLVLVGGEGGDKISGGMNRQLSALLLSRIVKQTLRAPVYMSHSKEHLETLKELIEAGKVTPLIDKTYPLDEAAEAIRHVGEGRARGKVVIVV